MLFNDFLTLLWNGFNGLMSFPLNKPRPQNFQLKKNVYTFSLNSLFSPEREISLKTGCLVNMHYWPIIPSRVPSVCASVCVCSSVSALPAELLNIWTSWHHLTTFRQEYWQRGHVTGGRVNAQGFSLQAAQISSSHLSCTTCNPSCLPTFPIGEIIYWSLRSSA